jgi:hypothetical protein
VADQTIVFPHPPSERWTPKWWNPRVTAVGLLLGTIAFFGITGTIGGVMMQHRKEDLRRLAGRDMSFMVTHEGARQVPDSMIFPLSRARLSDLDAWYGPILGWKVERTYTDLFGAGGAAIVFIHRQGGDMRLQFSYVGEKLYTTGNPYWNQAELKREEAKPH